CVDRNAAARAAAAGEADFVRRADAVALWRAQRTARRRAGGALAHAPHVRADGRGRWTGAETLAFDATTLREVQRGRRSAGRRRRRRASGAGVAAARARGRNAPAVGTC